MTTTLTDFLLARIAEDEAEQIDHDEHGPRGWHDFNCDLVHSEGHWDCDCGIPARVLAECAAKRRIVTQVEETKTEIKSVMPGGSGRLSLLHGLDMIEHLLALPHAAHPDFNPAWAV